MVALGAFWSCRRGVRQGSHHRQGDYDDGTSEQTLIEHWNGTAWKVEPTPNQGGSGDSNDLFGVAADSAGGAWAVGNYYDGTNNETLALHCC